MKNKINLVFRIDLSPVPSTIYNLGPVAFCDMTVSMSISKLQDPCTHVDVLIHIFETRKSRRPHYSQNAFARDIRLSPARLSQILNQKSGLSRGLAQQISDALNFSSEQREWFINSALKSHGRSPDERDRAATRLQKSRRPLEIFSSLQQAL